MVAQTGRLRRELAGPRDHLFLLTWGHPAPGPALGLMRTPHVGSGDWQPVGSGVRCGSLTNSRCPGWDVPPRLCSQPCGSSQGWNGTCAHTCSNRSTEAPAELRRVEPWRGTPWDEQEHTQASPARVRRWRGAELGSLGSFALCCQCVRPETGTSYGSYGQKRTRCGAAGMAVPLGSSSFW